MAALFVGIDVDLPGEASAGFRPGESNGEDGGDGDESDPGHGAAAGDIKQAEVRTLETAISGGLPVSGYFGNLPSSS